MAGNRGSQTDQVNGRRSQAIWGPAHNCRRSNIKTLNTRLCLKRQQSPSVIPAKAGNQWRPVDSRLRGNDRPLLRQSLERELIEHQTGELASLFQDFEVCDQAFQI